VGICKQRQEIWDAGSIELCGESYLSIKQLREFFLLSGTLRVEHSGETIDHLLAGCAEG